MKKALIYYVNLILLLSCVLFLPGGTLRAYATSADFAAEAEQRKLSPVESDAWESWPKAPANGAEGAFLMDIDTGAVLYSKNPEKQAYPASITKLMTALLTMEHCAMDEQVVFSHNAVYSIERGSSNVGIDEGQSMSVEECLYCLLLASANEVANALAEHISGSVESFAELMNERAAALGCTNTHFVNPNGLHDDNHYTCAGDMALIARAFAQNDKLLEISGTTSYHVYPTDNQPDDFVVSNHHRMLMGSLYGKRFSYEYTIGGKTGFTVMARETLVTFAEKDGMRLLCVILREEPYGHYTDTQDLFEYGFSEFKRIDLKEEMTDEVLTLLAIPENLELGEGFATLPASLTLGHCALTLEGETIEAYYDGRLVGTLPLTEKEQPEESLPVQDLTQANEAMTQESAENQTVSFGEEKVQEEKGEGLPLWVLLLIAALLLFLAIVGGFILMEKSRSNQARRKRQELMERRRRRMEEWDREDEQ